MDNAEPSDLAVQKTILSLCDYSGSWSQPYLDAGYKVIRYDLKLNKTDIRLLEKPAEPIYGILAAPPCTVFANSGARWKRSHDEMMDGLSIVDACIRIIIITKPKFWALENPVGKLKRFIGTPKLYFNPCDYGDAYTKKTCLWGEFNEPIKTPVEPVRVCNQGSWIQKLGGRSEKTKELRSATPAGFALAFFKANP